jgi:hypothetical protein
MVKQEKVMKNLNSILVIATVFLLLLSISVVGQDLVNFTFVDHLSVGLNPTPYQKWGQAIADIDNNGWIDIFHRRWGGHSHSTLYLCFDGIFSDISDQTPLASLEESQSHTRTVSLVDYDNDGDKDIFFGSDERLFLLRNDDNVFTEISESVGLIGHIPAGFIASWEYNIGAWVDIDLDGDLDVTICQSNNPDLYLFRNDDGIFTDVAAEYGFTGFVPLGTDGDRGNTTSRMHWIDFDMDGDLDLSAGQFLFRNENGVYTEIAQSSGLNPSLPIQNSDWFDFDNDGDLDFLKTCTFPENQGCFMELWENQDGAFVEASDLINHNSVLNLSRGLAIGDFDNDGDQDIFIDHNQEEDLDALMLNHEFEPGARYFENIIDYVGINVMGDRKGGAFIDYDHDGFLDLYIPAADVNHHLYHNDGNNNNWVGFILEGKQSNRDAIGTVVKLYAGGEIQLRYTKCPDGWLRQNNPWIHFGLGQTTIIDSVVINWPLGLTEVLTDVEINQYHEIKEGETTSHVGLNMATTPIACNLIQNYPNPFNPHTNITYTMSHPGDAKFNISNLLGKEIITYEKMHQLTGTYNLSWDGKNKNGSNVPTGIYICRFETKDFISSTKMLLIR